MGTDVIDARSFGGGADSRGMYYTFRIEDSQAQGATYDITLSEKARQYLMQVYNIDSSKFDKFITAAGRLKLVMDHV